MHKKNTDNLLDTRAKGLNRDIIKEKIQKRNKDMKRCPTSLVIRERQIKTVSRFYYIPARSANSLMSDNVK